MDNLLDIEKLVLDQVELRNGEIIGRVFDRLAKPQISLNTLNQSNNNGRACMFSSLTQLNRRLQQYITGYQHKIAKIEMKLRHMLEEKGLTPANTRKWAALKIEKAQRDIRETQERMAAANVELATNQTVQGGLLPCGACIACTQNPRTTTYFAESTVDTEESLQEKLHNFITIIQGEENGGTGRSNAGTEAVVDSGTRGREVGVAGEKPGDGRSGASGGAGGKEPRELDHGRAGETPPVQDRRGEEQKGRN